MKKHKNLVFFILTLLFVIPAIFSLFYHSFFTFHDETQIVNMHQFFKTIDLGQFPPRWGLDFHFNYGSPFPQFYYQLPYYLGYPFHLAGLSLVSIFKLLLISGFFIGAAGMYFLGLQFTTPLWSLVAAVVYTYTPYRAVASFVRGSLGESIALALFPWIFLSTYLLVKKPTFKKALLTGLTWSLLVITHQLAAIFFLPLVFLPVAFLAIKNKSLIKYLFISSVTTLGLSAYYWLPLAVEKSLIQPSSPFNFYDHFPFLKQLIYSDWGYRASLWGIDDGLSFQLGIVPWLIVIASLTLFPIIIKSKLNKLHKYTYGYSLLAFLGTLFLMNIRSSRFFWDIFPLTQLVQFPWRLLMITSFFVPLLLILLAKIIPKRFFLPLALVILLAAPISTIYYFQPGEIYDRPDDYYLHRYLPNQAAEDQGGISTAYLDHTEDYVSLPLTATRPSQLPPAKLTAANPETNITIKSDHPFHSIYQIEAKTEDVITFHTFDFPGWQISLNDQEIDITTDDIGAITFMVPEGESAVNIDYTNTPIKNLGNALSLISIFVFLGLIIPRPKKK